MAKHTSRGEG